MRIGAAFGTPVKVKRPLIMRLTAFFAFLPRPKIG